MTTNPVDPVDERSHDRGEERLWSESWYFDFFQADGSLGGWVRIGLCHNLGAAWYHAYVVGPGRPILAVQDLEAPLPKPGSLEVRTHGLWADHTCETPLEHFTIANETHALSVDDPVALYAREPRGDQVPVGLDLEFETDGSPHHYLYTTRYEIPCRVHGEVLIGDERIELDGWGQRDHSWGERDWWKFGWVWCSGRLDDGTRFHGSDIRIPNIDVGFGYVQPGEQTNNVNADEQLGPEGFPTAATITIGDFDVLMEPIAFAPALLTLDDMVDRFPRALCRVETPDGRKGFCWTEWNQPQP